MFACYSLESHLRVASFIADVQCSPLIALPRLCCAGTLDFEQGAVVVAGSYLGRRCRRRRGDDGTEHAQKSTYITRPFFQGGVR